MSKFQWNSKLHIFEILTLNTEGKDWKSCKNVCTKNFTYTKNFYVQEIAAINLSKLYFLKNAKKTWKPNKRDWMKSKIKFWTTALTCYTWNKYKWENEVFFLILLSEWEFNNRNFWALRTLYHIDGANIFKEGATSRSFEAT